jgi:hypothetical protein
MQVCGALTLRVGERFKTVVENKDKNLLGLGRKFKDFKGIELLLQRYSH